MAKRWAEVEQAPEYQQLDPQSKMEAKQQYFKEVVSANPEFVALPDDEKKAATQEFIGNFNENPQQSDKLNSSGIMQGGVGFFKAVRGMPFIKGIEDRALKNSDYKTFEGLEQAVGEPNSIGTKAAKMVGEVAGYAPGFVAGEGSVASNGAKLAAGSVGTGIQEAANAKAEGANPQESLAAGAKAAAGTFVGGKVLKGAGDMIAGIPNAMRSTSARINNMIAKLPEKAYNYAKDPSAVFNKEKIVGNTITDYAKAADERLDLRAQQLNEAAAKNPNKVKLGNMINDHLEAAKDDVLESTNKELRESQYKKLSDLQSELNGRDLDNMSIKDAIQLKRQLAKDYPFAFGEPKTSTSNTIPSTAHKIHHGINEAIDEVAPEISDLNQRVSGLIDITKAAQHRVHVESRNNPLGLIGTIIGVGAAGAVGEKLHGGSIGESAGAGITAAIAMKALSSPAVMSRVAATLSHMADADKINLYEAVPWFKDIAHKVEDFTKQGNLSMQTGEAGTKTVTPEIMPNNGPARITQQPNFTVKDIPAEVSPGVKKYTPNTVSDEPAQRNTDMGPETDPNGFLADAKKRLGNESGEAMIGGSKATGPLKKWTPLIDQMADSQGKRLQIDKLKVSDTVKAKLLDHYGLLRDKAGEVLASPVGTVAAAGTAIAAGAAAGQPNNMDDIKQKLGSVENFDKSEGNYAHITPVVIKDLQQNGLLFKGYTFKQVMDDPKLYDKAVKKYWEFIGDDKNSRPGIPEDQKYLWWRRPYDYKKYKGDVNKMPAGPARQQMVNRIKNYNASQNRRSK